jgi:hypothetical protein
VQAYPTDGFAPSPDEDKTSYDKTTPDKIQAYGMLLRSPGWMVSKKARVTRMHGVRDQVAKQMRDDGLRLAFMIERQLLSNVDTRAASAGVDERSRGVYSWLSPTAQGVLPVNANYRPSSSCLYSSAVASFAPSHMETMLAAAANAKRAPVDLVGYVGMTLKGQMSGWSQRQFANDSVARALQVFNIDASEKKLITVIDFFEFDAGTVKTIPTWNMMCAEADGATSDYTARSGAFLDMSMWELAWLQEPQHSENPDQGGGPRGFHDAMFILKGLNPLGQCMVLTAT